MSRKVQLIRFEAGNPPNPNNNNREVNDKLKTRRQKGEWRKNKLFRQVDYTEKLDDGRGRRIIYRDTLFASVEGLIDMTKQTEQILPTDYFKRQPFLQKHVMSKPNKLEQWFNKANAKPLNSSKAESMMQKMGWSGGALGKTGSGITEPITPNMSYAMYHKGLGTVKVEVPVMSKKQRRQPSAEKLQQRQQRLIEKESFKINVLSTILEFVRNEDEVEILFDCLLANHQRKQIHQLIEAIRSLEGLSAARLKPESMAFLDLVYKITRFNRYLLMTQSEGVMPYRYLCLFKKAPPFMYLVTTLDLRDQPKILIQVQQPRIRNVKGKTIIKYSKHRNMYLRNIETDEKTPEIDETVLWLFEDCPKRDNEDGNETKDSKDSNKDVNEIKDIKNSNNGVNEIKDEKDSVCIEKDNLAGTSKNTDTVKNGTCNNSFDNANESSIKNNEALNKNQPNDIKNEKASTSSYKEEINETVTKKPKYEDERFDEDNFDYSNKCDDYKYDDYDYIVDDENMNNDEQLSEIVYEGETKNQFIDHKTLLRNKIVSYFAEFVQLPQFREFKFLGKFNSEEFQIVDDFTKQVWLYLNGDPIDNADLVSVIGGAECGFSMQEDCNGATAIMKILHNTGSIEEDESIF